MLGKVLSLAVMHLPDQIMKQFCFLFNSGTYMNHTLAGSCDLCPPRYYCVNKDRADPCPQGRVCEGSTGFNMTLCPSGTYSDVEYLMDTSECKPCDPGSYCDVPGLTAVSGPCSAGYYCQSGVDIAAPSGANTGSGGEIGDLIM